MTNYTAILGRGWKVEAHQDGTPMRFETSEAADTARQPYVGRIAVDVAKHVDGFFYLNHRPGLCHS